ncbi:MAG: peptide deformylase [Thiolinea sp.]
MNTPLTAAKILAIAQQGELILSQRARAVSDPLDPEIQTLLQNMQATMLAANGVGIAAPQVFQSLRIIIVASRPNPRYPEAALMEPIAMINPEILWQSNETCLGEEGCLSVQETRAQIARAERLTARYLNEKAESIEAEFSGFVARIIQHEVDHLEGILFVERAEAAES